MKKTEIKTAALLLVGLMLLQPAAAAAEPTLVPMGTTIGIRMETDGLVVIGIADAEESSPAWKAGIRVGDILMYVNQTRVTTARELRGALSGCGNAAAVRFLRGGTEMQVTVQLPPGEDGVPELGVWLRSGLSGIGTMTWFDPSDHSFAALGHGVSDPDSGVLLPLKSGCIGKGCVEAVTKGCAGAPGELRGSLGLENPVGSITVNASGGIFGVWERGTPDGAEALPVCPEREIRCGDAEILSDVSGERERYAVKILRLYRDESTRDLLLQVTDARLLALTGGIVQGMSGSPIVQDGRIIGAVTHVLVNDPSKGYGISAETMLEQLESTRKAA